MIALRTVLMPTDFSAPANRALEYAKSIAENFHAALHVLHVEEDIAIGDPMLTASALADIQEAAESFPTRIAAAFTAEERSRLKLVTAVVRGSPHDAILDYAKEHGIELIVLGTHGRGMVERLLLGSVAERIVRHAPCPVLTVKAQN